MSNAKGDSALLARALRIVLEEVVKEARIADPQFAERVNERVHERIRQAQLVVSNVAANAERPDLARMRDYAADIVREIFRKP